MAQPATAWHQVAHGPYPMGTRGHPAVPIKPTPVEAPSTLRWVGVSRPERAISIVAPAVPCHALVGIGGQIVDIEGHGNRLVNPDTMVPGRPIR